MQNVVHRTTLKAIGLDLAYRLSRYHRDPFGSKVLTAEVGSSKYKAGRKVSMKVISGHRDSQLTACPGGNLYKRIPTIRKWAAAEMGSSLIEPTVPFVPVPLGFASIDLMKARCRAARQRTIRAFSACLIWRVA